MLSKTRLRLGILSLFQIFTVNLLQAQSGCTDEAACNFDPIAVTDDGSCIQPSGAIVELDSWPAGTGLGVPGGIMFDVEASQDVVVKTLYLSDFDNVVTIYKKTSFGTHTTALEDQAQWEIIFSANVAWNSTLYANTGYYAESGLVNVFIPAGQIQAFYVTSSTGISNQSFDQTQVVATDGVATIYGGTGFFDVFDTSGYGDYGAAWSGAINYLTIVQGCTDLSACNYDSAANCDDGSCIAPGCTDPTSCNYDPITTCDDGSCIAPSGTIVELDSWPTGTGLGVPGGMMFDVEATQDLVVKTLYLSDFGNVTTIYKKTTYGTHTTALEDQAQWEVIFSANVPYDGAVYASTGYYAESGIVNVFIPAGQIQAFYVTSGTTVSNQNFDQTQVVATDGVATIYGGTGFFDVFDTSGYGDYGKAWSGAINYLAIVQGCTDSTACNFDSAATCDNGSCLTDFGCTNPVACNFNSSATCDDGSCTLPQWYLPNTIGSGPMLYACSLPAGYFLADQACAQTVVDNDPYCVNTAWDNICSRAYNCCLGNFGCNNPTACNYDPTLCEDNLLCTFPGCTDNTACNYDSAAGCDNGSCILPNGCTDPTACNYDALATCDDGSCIEPSGTIVELDSWPTGTGLGVPGGMMFDVEATQDLVVKTLYLSDFGNVTTIYKKTTYGTHTTALEDQAQWEVIFSANVPYDGTVYASTGYYAESGVVNVFIPAGQIQAFYVTSGTTVSNQNFDQTQVVATDGVATIYGGTGFFDVFDTSGYGDYGKAWSGAINYLAIAQGCTDPSACNYDAAATCDDGSCILPDGCTDNTACNYNAAALCDDGSCVLPDGCTDPAACNYDAAAVCDDGSCNVLGNPEIQSVPGNFLDCSGGDAVTIFGTNFCPNSLVTIDGIPVFDLVITESTIDFTMPPGTGAVTLEVSGVNGTWMALLAYAPPAINGILNSTSYCGGETITIDGVNFCDAFEVNIGGQSASIISVEANSIVCTVPLPSVSGDVPLIVTSPSGISFPVSINYGVVGCTNPSACNYDVTATCEDGSCILPDGCTNPAACNYDSAAVCDDGSCNVLGNPEIFAVPANTLACFGGDPVTIFGVNFCPNSVVTIDGSPALNLIITETTLDFIMPPGTGTVTLEVSGVNGTWMALLGYAAPVINSTSNSFSCFGGETVTIFGTNLCDVTSVEVGGQSAAIISSDPNSVEFTIPAPLASGDVSITVITPSGISNSILFNYGVTGCVDSAACNYNALATCDDGSCTYPGCLYPEACNYSPSASCDDGSCEFTSCAVSGCTYPSAPEYNPSATTDDGSCTLAGIDDCPADLNNDGIINTGDLNSLLGVYGLTCP